jgi:2-keto-4-pentenoate hydratase/2-oxohepta-3-ene-1,7-dioic acid hydratase in catechol pathway
VQEGLRIGRFADGSRVFFAHLEGDGIREAAGDPFAGLGSPGRCRPVDGLHWLIPCDPSKIVCIGRNYRSHAAELGHELPQEPLLFLKPPSSLLPHGGVIRLPNRSRRVDFEGELGIVISRRARGVAESRAREYVLGYTCINDVTARDLQEKDVQFTRAKGFDSFCPVGPCIATGIDPSGLTVETFVNGVRRQSDRVSRMVFGVEALVSYVSGVMTLEPGDLIATGTPAGVGPLTVGDEVAVSIEGIGRLVNRVEADAGEVCVPRGSSIP